MLTQVRPPLFIIMEETLTFEKQLEPQYLKPRSQNNNLLCKKMLHQALEEQVPIINKLLGEERENYYLDDIYNILPNKITWHKKTGYLKISKYDIVYSIIHLFRFDVWVKVLGALCLFAKLYDKCVRRTP